MHRVQEKPGLLQESSGGPNRIRQEKIESGVNLDPRGEKQGKLNSQTEIEVGKSKRKIIIKDKRGGRDKKLTAEGDYKASEKRVKSTGESKASSDKRNHKRSL